MLALAVVVATVAAFVLSFAFYSLAPAATDETASEERPRAWQIVVELLRSAIVSGLVAGLLVTAGWGGAGQGALVGLALWALPVVLLAGSVLWERVPVRSAALHSG